MRLLTPKHLQENHVLWRPSFGTSSGVQYYLKEPNGDEGTHPDINIATKIKNRKVADKLAKEKGMKVLKLNK